MLNQFRNRRFYLILAADTVIFIMALVGAYLLRFDFTVSTFYLLQIIQVLMVILPIKLLIFFAFGLYRVMWRYTSLIDLVRMGEATLLSTFFTQVP